MKKMEKVTLINWHYVSYETMELKDVNFLTGKNGSGKTTIIDAFQILLLADTTGHYFNKSASDKSSRTLKGYLRCEIGDGEQGVQYLRNGRFTTYVVAIINDDKINKKFTIGAGFDTYETGDYDTRFFICDGVVEKEDLLNKNIAVSTKELKLKLMEKLGKDAVNFYETNVSYKEALKVKLGNLNNNFFTLFKKSVPFAPISDIEKFITEYICDVKYQIDISSMQENIRAYKQLELEADIIASRVEALKNIEDAYNDWHNDETKLRIQKYMLNRLDLMVKEKQINVFKEQIESNDDDIAYSKTLIQKNAAEIASLSVEKEKLLEEKFSSDAFKQKASLEQQEEQLRKQIDSLDYKVENLKDSFTSYYAGWNNVLKSINNYQDKDDSFKDVKDLARKISMNIDLFNINSNDLPTVERKDYISLQASLSEFKNICSGVARECEREGKEQHRTRENLFNVINSLNKGVKVYDARLLKLRELIKQALFDKYHKDIEVSILADMIEIKNRRWANVIEGYLSSQKFYLFVEPAYVNDAIAIYDKVKFEYNLFDFGIVDTAKIMEAKHDTYKNALSEEITTDNKYARAFIDMTIGGLIKCDRVEDLRKYNRSITDSGMLYQGYVARQINKDRWRNPFIGNNALKSQIDLAKSQIKECEDIMFSLKEKLVMLNIVSNLENINNYQIESLVTISQEVKDLPMLKEQHSILLNAIDSIDSSYILVLNNKLETVTKKLELLNNDKEDIISNISKLETDNERIKEELLPGQERIIEDAKNKINASFTKDWINEVGEPTFIAEISTKQDIDRLFKVYQSEIASLDNGLSRKFNKVVNLRSSYVTAYKLGYDVNDISNKVFSDEYNEFSTNLLASYKEKIVKAKENALIQFKNDFLSKLKGNFDTVKLQIEKLNEALEDSTFGNDSYHFVVNPRPEYREYYDMINDPMLVEGVTLFDDAFNEVYGETVENLFRQITYVDDELSGNMKGEIAKNIDKYTDYRTYLKFDLIVKDEAGRKQFLSKTLLKKSGGETQTPFYISILASFAQLYRVSEKNANDPGTIRLIIFDEAFSKMDSERIQESVKLLRHYGLQAILSAPPEKMADIVPLVDQTLCVIRDSNKALIRGYNKI